MQSQKNTLNKEELNQWIHETIIFSIPLLILFLQSLQTGMPLKDALIAVYGAGINALVNLLIKFKQGSTV